MKMAGAFECSNSLHSCELFMAMSLRNGLIHLTLMMTYKISELITQLIGKLLYILRNLVTQIECRNNRSLRPPSRPNVFAYSVPLLLNLKQWPNGKHWTQ